MSVSRVPPMGVSGAVARASRMRPTSLGHAWGNADATQGECSSCARNGHVVPRLHHALLVGEGSHAATPVERQGARPAVREAWCLAPVPALRRAFGNCDCVLLGRRRRFVRAGQWEWQPRVIPTNGPYKRIGAMCSRVWIRSRMLNTDLPRLRLCGSSAEVH